MSVDSIVEFHSGGVDHRGRTLAQILAWSDTQLESVHDYIQWVFPTIQPSGVNPYAPLVTRDTIRAFDERPELREGLRRALDRMLVFYGLRWETGPPRGVHLPTVSIVVDTARFPERARSWLRPYNHNHLRLTRITDSLSTFGLRDEARALQRCLVEDICHGPGKGKISEETRDYWFDAVPERQKAEATKEE